jgi:hypothetical protein
MKNLIPVEANPQLARDASSGAILNVDRTSYRAFVEQKHRRAAKDVDLQAKLNTLQSQVDDLNKKFELLMKAQGNS